MVFDPVDFGTLSDEDIANLGYPAGNNRLIFLGKGMGVKLRCLRDFTNTKLDDGFDMYDPALWFDVSPDEYKGFFQRWRRTLFPSPFDSPPPVPSGSVGPPSPRSTVKGRSPADDMRKNIKLDPSAFPMFRDENKWAPYKRSLLAQARAMNLQNVLDPNYTPNTAEETELFKVQNDFLYSVFDRTLKSPHASAFVIDHEASGDAQKVYAALLKQFDTNSAIADDNCEKILSFLTSERLGPGQNWRNTTSEFVNYWLTQATLHTQLSDPSQHLTENQRLLFLQNAVAPHPILNQVTEVAKFEALKPGGTKLSFDTYVTLLRSACYSYDKTTANIRNHEHPTTSRHINAATFAPDLATLADDDPSSAPFDYEMPISQYYAYAAARHPPASTMPRSAWYKIPAAERAIWDKLSDETKAVILQAKCPPVDGENGEPEEREENGEQSEDTEKRVSFNVNVKDTKNKAAAKKVNDKLLAFAGEMSPVEFQAMPTETKAVVLDRLVNAAEVDFEKHRHPGQLGRMMSKSLGKPPERYKSASS